MLADDLFLAIIIGLSFLPIFGTVLGWHDDTVRSRRVQESSAQAGICPACHHPEHWPWCTVFQSSLAGEDECDLQCWCDLFTEPAD